uniref:Uncharacterized protein LOC111099034 n=1 Tax=Crassostrea virginica TaxID=6565 RepID=A0A8B8A3J6_CRAVI|nr:uncharacterized protein LOC111099034 [Crassostrea virginica]
MTTSTTRFFAALANANHEEILGLTSSRQLSMKKKFRYRKKNGFHDVEDEMTSLLLTIKHCYRLDVIEKMIAMGADVNATGYEYLTPTRKRLVSPLYFAVSKSCNKELLLCLISAGTDLNKFSGEMFENEEEGGSMNFLCKSSCLDYALHSRFYDPEVIDILLENGADYNIRNDSSMLPLQIAMMYNHNDAVLSLVRYGACESSETYSTYSPLGLLLDFDNLIPEDERGSPQQQERSQSSLTQCVSILLNGGYDVFHDSEMLDLCERCRAQKETDKSTSAVCGVISEWMFKPKDLKILCRLKIRQILKNQGVCNPRTICKLPVPKLVTSYLNLCDLE